MGESPKPWVSIQKIYPHFRKPHGSVWFKFWSPLWQRKMMISWQPATAGDKCWAPWNVHRGTNIHQHRANLCHPSWRWRSFRVPSISCGYLEFHVGDGFIQHGTYTKMASLMEKTMINHVFSMTKPYLFEQILKSSWILGCLTSLCTKLSCGKLLGAPKGSQWIH